MLTVGGKGGNSLSLGPDGAEFDIISQLKGRQD